MQRLSRKQLSVRISSGTPNLLKIDTNALAASFAVQFLGGTASGWRVA